MNDEHLKKHEDRRWIRAIQIFPFLVVLALVAAAASRLPGFRVPDSIVPYFDTDEYPTHLATYGKGGLRTVADTSQLASITTLRREPGMLVYVTNQGAYYTLAQDGTTWYVSPLGTNTVPDGDRGEITVSSGIWIIDSGVVTTGKLSTGALEFIEAHLTEAEASALYQGTNANLTTVSDLTGGTTSNFYRGDGGFAQVTTNDVPGLVADVLAAASSGSTFDTNDPLALASTLSVDGDTTVSNLTINGTATASTLNVSTINATNIVGDGSSITNLNGDNIASGTVADARIASTLARDSEVTSAISGLLNEAAASALYQATNPALTTLASLNGGSLTNLDGANIQSGTVNSNALDAATLALLGPGDVSGPASSTDTAVARFNGTGGKTLQDSGVLIDGSDNVTIPGNASVGGTLSMDTLAVASMTVTNPIEIASGGTGTNTAAGARTTLGLAIGSDVQGYDTDLAAVAAGTAMPTALTNAVSVGAPSLIAGTTNVASALAAKAPSASPTLTAPTLNDGVTFEQTTPSAHSAVTNWVVDPTASQYQYIATGTNVNFLHATNAAAGRQTVFLIGRNAAGTSTVTIPSALFAFNTNTIDVAENEFVAVSFYYYGSNNTNVIATVGNVYSR